MIIHALITAVILSHILHKYQSKMNTNDKRSEVTLYTGRRLNAVVSHYVQVVSTFTRTMDTNYYAYCCIVNELSHKYTTLAITPL